MHQSSKLLVTYKERSCFDHSDYQTHLMYAEVAWVLVSSETHVQPQIILDPDYLPNYPFVYYDYDYNSNGKIASKSCHRKRSIYFVALNPNQEDCECNYLHHFSDTFCYLL